MERSGWEGEKLRRIFETLRVFRGNPEEDTFTRMGSCQWVGVAGSWWTFRCGHPFSVFLRDL